MTFLTPPAGFVWLASGEDQKMGNCYHVWHLTQTGNAIRSAGRPCYRNRDTANSAARRGAHRPYGKANRPGKGTV